MLLPRSSSACHKSASRANRAVAVPPSDNFDLLPYHSVIVWVFGCKGTGNLRACQENRITIWLHFALSICAQKTSHTCLRWLSQRNHVATGNTGRCMKLGAWSVHYIIIAMLMLLVLLVLLMLPAFFSWKMAPPFSHAAPPNFHTALTFSKKSTPFLKKSPPNFINIFSIIGAPSVAPVAPSVALPVAPNSLWKPLWQSASVARVARVAPTLCYLLMYPVSLSNCFLAFLGGDKGEDNREIIGR